jgi:hypothetical protein
MIVKRTIPPIGAPLRGQRNNGKMENVTIDSANGASVSEARTVAVETYFFDGYGVPSRWVYPLASAIISMAGYVQRSLALAGPSPCLNDSHVHAELSQPRKTSQPLNGLSAAGLVERTR